MDIMSPDIATPVAFFVFNRPDTTHRVFEAIRAARPRKLFVFADGPRNDRPEEAALCADVRKITENVDWPCEVVRDYAEENLGCRLRMAGGITSLFEEVEEAIILEDDSLPHPTFFRFCEELLARYRNDDRVGQICGVNFQRGLRRGDSSYYFSRYNHLWGWATWRRSWNEYDLQMSKWPSLRDGGWLYDFLRDPLLYHYWYKKFEKAYTGRIDSWDYQWNLATWSANRLAVIPSVNLVTNIGVTGRSRKDASGPNLCNIPSEELMFPLHHPLSFIRDALSDSNFEALDRKINIREPFHKDILRKIRYRFKFRY
jgi:hypothetical protein